MNMQLLAQCIQQAHNANAQGKFETALANCQQALALAPNLPEAHYNLAIALHGQGHGKRALESLHKTAKLAGHNPDALNSIGLLCTEWGALPDADRYLQKSIQLAPGFALPHANLGKLRVKQHRLAEAVTCVRKAIELQPDLAQLHSNLGGVLNSLKQYEAAEAALRKAIDLDPHMAEAWSNLGATLGVLNSLKQYEAAEAALRKAIDLDPHMAEAWSNLGATLSDQGDFTQALACYEKALHLDPSSATTHSNYSHFLLKTENYSKGWVEYEYRFEGGRIPSKHPDTSLPQWRGEPNTENTSILLYSEQGFGDCIQFMRYIPMLKGKFAHISYICPSPLVTLVKTNFPEIEVLDSENSIDKTRFHWHCPLLSLALAFKTTLDSIPRTPYLPLPYHSEPQQKISVGFAWRGNPAYDCDTWRSIPLETFSRLFKIAGVNWISLNKDIQPEDADLLPPGSEKSISEVRDFLDTAKIMADLDLIITIDSAVAHLAGAMGKPVWLLNRASSEWRWGWKKETSPWYPSMRIYNQNRMGDWGPVIDDVSAALSVFTHTHQERQHSFVPESFQN